jgi:hypothetical protein
VTYLWAKVYDRAMPYFIDIGRNVIVVTAPGHWVSPVQRTTMVEVDRFTAEACGLRHEQTLTDAQVDALRKGSIDEFRLLTTTPADAQESTPTATARTSSAAQRASTVARLVEFASWVFLVICISVGIGVASVPTTNAITGESEHSNVLAGVAIAIGGAFQALVVIMVATYIIARTESALD